MKTYRNTDEQGDYNRRTLTPYKRKSIMNLDSLVVVVVTAGIW